MGSEAELEAMAKRIIDGNRYMSIATADGAKASNDAAPE